MSRVLSVNLATARTVSAPRSTWSRTSGIDKRPVDHPVQVTAPGRRGVAGSGMAGDDVCNLRHHGGDDQAVYAYAREDLDRWESELGRTLPSGCFGENLTTTGISVSDTVVGERWRIGDGLVLEVSDPRIPCRTFATFLDERAWMRRFTEAAAPGTYFRVVTPGAVRAGDPITVLSTPDHGITVALAFRAMTTEPDLLPHLVDATGLSQEARDNARRRTRIALDTDPQTPTDA
ncbi:MOSC domain-containing protein [Nakamurella flavida]|uniref:MOSC domain-containing protein n=1 Tax=Nakamurella flavida TaxID=363630 RepID=A0A938YHS4_9ACTN|nr:MOSC domain-containing protein [Nakamurella flavida]MBM9474993.1 MOSC domain-containing protein [Nakamurella flavida]MDP9776562.1 MOSC domain-containing protein YiiM [Nakamurella flavida]